MLERTRDDILNAFNRLIEKQHFDKISVTLICQEAKISKATFYRYYHDKYDVMNTNYKSLLDYYSHPEISHNYEELYFHLYSVAKNQWHYLENAFDTVGVNSFNQYVYEYSFETIINITSVNRNGEGLSEEEYLQCDILCKGISFMFENWILGKYPLDPKSAAHALYEIMPESLKYYWWK